jgi:hypothetical protein
MKHYLKHTHEFVFGNYDSFMAFNEDNLSCIDLVDNNVEVDYNYNDAEDIRDSCDNRIKNGAVIITKQEFDNALIKFNNKFNQLIKEL